MKTLSGLALRTTQKARKRLRENGTGTIDRLESGRWRFRWYAAGAPKRQSQTFDTREQAEIFATGIGITVASAAAAQASTESCRTLGLKWLDCLEAEGYGDIATHRSRWRNHVELAPFYDWPLSMIRPKHVRAWIYSLLKKSISPKTRRKEKPLSRRTVERVLTLIRTFFEGQLHDELDGFDANPAAGVSLPPEEETEEPYTYYTPEEQKAIYECAEIPEVPRLWLAVLNGTGLRLGEFNNQRLEDVHAFDVSPYMIVRFGKAKKGKQSGRAKDDSAEGGSTKGKRVRKVWLFGYALLAMRRWLEILPDWCPKNPRGLAFPGRKGAARGPGKLLERSVRIGKKVHKQNMLPVYLARARIYRHVTHHTSRHTNGTDLMEGTWGPAWRLDDVQIQFGHKSRDTTARFYDHSKSRASQEAASKMPPVAPGSLGLPEVLPPVHKGAPILPIAPRPAATMLWVLVHASGARIRAANDNASMAIQPT